MNNTTRSTISLDADEVAGVDLVKRYRKKRLFTSMRLINSLTNQQDSPDLLDLLGSMSKGARDLFLLIKNQMDYRTHIAFLESSELSRGQQNKRSAAYRELAELGLVRKLPATGLKNSTGIEMHFPIGNYMVSPEYIYPNDRFLDEIEYLWDQVR